MATIAQNQGKSIRNLPINMKLRRVLLRAANASGVEVVEVISGGQPATGKNRTGSHRHDHGNAADLRLRIGKRLLNFMIPRDLPIVEAFVTAAAASGATGIGAGSKYMGPSTLHIGFGSRSVWGAGGMHTNAPKWLVRAVERGWQSIA